MLHSVSAAYGARSASAEPSSSSKQPAPGSQFLELIAAQLRCQNPLEPLSDAELMSQVTQLAILDELRQVRLTLDRIAEGGEEP